MSVRMLRVLLLSSSALMSLCCLVGAGSAQTPAPAPAPETPQAQPQPGPSAPGTLPTINVETSKKKPPAKKQVERRPPPQPVQPSAETQQAIERRQIQTQVTTFNDTRRNIYTTVGANSETVSKEDIQKLPQGENTPVDRVLLQTFPGVSRIPPPAAFFISATSTPMWPFASTASCCPMASPA